MEHRQVEWCPDCGRAIGIGCNCGLSFAERIKGLQVDKFGLMDSERKQQDPKNKGLERKLK